ncbi:MAG TPA: hypothetical protein PLU50_07480, partial [Pseudobdellovibrionaceae bacterium]|nr:hypothetical protein [Pseudobdellovibrionaceae bacterium]
LNGTAHRGCKVAESPIYGFSAKADAFPVEISLLPTDLMRSDRAEQLIDVDPNGTSTAFFRPEFKLYEAATQTEMQNIQSVIADQQSLRDSLWTELRNVFQSKFSHWISDRLRGFIVVQSIASLMEDSPVWKKGPILSRGGLTIEMDGPPVSKRQTLFCSAPFKTNSTFLSQTGLEIYTHARFLSEDDLRVMHGDHFKLMGLTDLELNSRKYLSNPDHWMEGLFSRPQLAPIAADLSLMVPTSLINDALQTIYREGLLRFRTTIQLGKQTQGIITPDAPEVATVVGISPLSAPKISFIAQKPILQIVDYALDISTAIEDRLIPSSRILTNASLVSGLKLDPLTQTVNLKVEPNSFRMTLRDLTGRLSPEQIDIFQRLANGLWRDFLSKYSDLVLFPSVISTQQAELQIVGLEFPDSMVVLHFNVNWGKISL